MKKIAILVFDITQLAGTERAVCNLANSLVESQKYSVSIISMNSIHGTPRYIINSSVQLYNLGIPESKNIITRLKLYKLLIKKVDEFCQKEGIKIVIGTGHGLNILLFFLRKRVKIIACEHMSYMDAPLISKILRRVVYPCLDAVVTLTSADGKNYSFHRNLKIIPNSLPFLPEKHSDLTNKVILAIGNLTPTKGFDLLINAISLIKNECNGWVIKIIGAGEDEKKLRLQIDVLKLNELVKIYPPTNAIEQEYLQSSIFVLSSRLEGFGLVLIEAQSCGLPIVSFDCPSGPGEIVSHNENGILVKNGDIKQLSMALLELIQDSKKRNSFGKKALQSIDRYKSEKVFILWDLLLEQL